ncbi:hypothetical protein Q8G40_30595, partial [Klebsiella pneumoniae]|uniref:hypothetical protein n=1 Tax=Klebsiella pneumoniae TaxID=573 RepID=UPI003013C041
MQLSILEAAAVTDVPSIPAVRAAPDELALKLSAFLKQLDEWRTDAREGSLADHIWRIYRDTSFYDFVGGLPGGVQ